MLWTSAWCASGSCMSPARPASWECADHVLGHAGGADRMSLRLESAGDVDRQSAVAGGPPLLDRAASLTGFGQAEHLVDDELGDGETVVHLGEGHVGEGQLRHLQGALGGQPAGGEVGDVAAVGVEVVVGVGEPLDPGQCRRRVPLQDERGGAVADERAVGAAQLPGHHRIALGDGGAELDAEILADLCPGVGAPVRMILRRDPAEHVAEVVDLMASGVLICHLGEDAHEAAGEIGSGALRVGAEQCTPDGGVVDVRHLLRADHEHGVGRPGQDGLDALVDRGRARGAGVLDPGHGLAPESGCGSHRKGGREGEIGEAAVELGDEDLVDLAGVDLRVGQGLGGDRGHQ